MEYWSPALDRVVADAMDTLSRGEVIAINLEAFGPDWDGTKIVILAALQSSGQRPDLEAMISNGTDGPHWALFLRDRAQFPRPLEKFLLPDLATLPRHRLAVEGVDASAVGAKVWIAHGIVMGEVVGGVVELWWVGQCQEGPFGSRAFFAGAGPGPTPGEQLLYWCDVITEPGVTAARALKILDRVTTREEILHGRSS